MDLLRFRYIIIFVAARELWKTVTIWQSCEYLRGLTVNFRR